MSVQAPSKQPENGQKLSRSCSSCASLLSRFRSLSVSSVSPWFILLSSVVHVTRREFQCQKSEDKDDREEDPGHGAGVAHAQVEKGVVVEIDRQEVGRARRLASGRHDVG